MAAVLLGCSESTSSEVSPLLLPLEDRIVFASNRVDSLYDIYTIKTDGTDARRLTGDGKADFCPAVSPDGNWIAYYERDPASATHWYSLVLMRADGTDRRVLADVEPPFPPNYCPQWSRDSKYFLFPKLRQHADGLLEIFSPLTGAAWSYRSYGVGSPRLSPSGNEIAFVTWLETIGPDIDHQITVVRSNGSLQKRLSNGTTPSWSPDGASLIHACYNEGPVELTTRICLVGSVQGSPRTIFPQTAGLSPIFSPDGNLIAYRCGGSRLCFVASDATGIGPASGVELRQPLLTFGYREPTFAWSHDSRFVAFDCATSNNEICVMQPDGSEFRNLTNNSASDVTPSWAPSSSR